MSYTAVTLRVISSVLSVLGLGITGSLVAIFTVPNIDRQSELITWLMYSPLLLLLVGAVWTFRPFHELRWPAIVVGTVGALLTIAALTLLKAGLAESARTPQGPLDGIGGAIMTILSLYALVGAGALLLGAFLSLVSHRWAAPAD